MIIAGQMKRAVNHQVFDLSVETQTLFARVTFGGFDRNHDVSNVTRFIVIGHPSAFMISEGKHICRSVNPAIIAVQSAHGAVAYEGNCQKRVREADPIEQVPRQFGGSISVNLAQSLAIQNFNLLSLRPSASLSVCPSVMARG